MDTQTGFIIKVLLLSTAISVFIKYGGRYVPLQPTNAITTIIDISPSLIIGFILGWRYLQKSQN